jgi:Domain of unknown function (DUF4190)
VADDEHPASEPTTEAPPEVAAPQAVLAGPAVTTALPPSPTRAASNGFAVVSLVLGIVGVVLTITFILGLICDVLAVVFGALGRTKAREGAENEALATAGMILGLVGLGLLLLLVVAFRAGGFHAHLFFLRGHMASFHRGIGGFHRGMGGFHTGGGFQPGGDGFQPGVSGSP